MCAPRSAAQQIYTAQHEHGVELHAGWRGTVHAQRSVAGADRELREHSHRHFRGSARPVIIAFVAPNLVHVKVVQLGIVQD